MGPGEAILTGLGLGLASGGHCFWVCASVMGPYLVATCDPPGERWSSVPGALRTLGWYNLGRLVAYLAVGLLVAGLARSAVAIPAPLRAAALLLTAAILGLALWRPSRPSCPAAGRRAGRERHRRAGALLVGVLQGLSPCPPFVIAVGLGLTAGSMLAGVLLFLSLFVATALYTLPLALLEPLRRRRWLVGVTRAIGVLVCLHLVVRGVGLLRG